MANLYPAYTFTAALTPKSTEVIGTNTNQITVGIQNPSQTVTQSTTLKTISTWLPNGRSPNFAKENGNSFTLYGKDAVRFDALYGSSGLNWFTRA